MYVLFFQKNGMDNFWMFNSFSQLNYSHELKVSARCLGKSQRRQRCRGLSGSSVYRHEYRSISNFRNKKHRSPWMSPANDSSTRTTRPSIVGYESKTLSVSYPKQSIPFQTDPSTTWLTWSLLTILQAGVRRHQAHQQGEIGALCRACGSDHGPGRRDRRT